MSDIVDNARLTATRDLPHSVGELFTGWYESCKHEIIAPIPFVSKIQKTGKEVDEDLKAYQYENLSKKEKKQLKWNMMIAAGNLLSDGYINGSTSIMSTCLKMLYGTQYTNSSAISNVSSITFAGVCFGQLFFTFYSMYFNRRSGLLLSNAVMVFFSILAACAWTTTTTDTHAGGLFNLITVCLFFLGVGIGAEYPLGSSMGSDYSSSLSEGQRGRWLILFTNFSLSFGFILSSLIPLILLCICGVNHLQPVWRLTIGLGAVAPAFFFICRWKLPDSEKFKKQEFKTTHIPYILIFKFYWFRLFLLAMTWFAFDFSSYGFGTYFSIVLTDISPTMSLKANFGWNTLFSVADAVGCLLGAFFTDYWGPRIAGSLGAIVQAIMGYLIAYYLKDLSAHSGAFATLFCIFQAANSFGFGNNTFYLCSNSSSSNSKMLVFAICAFAGKLGAFVATYIFPHLMDKHGGFDTISGLQQPYWASCTLTVVATAIFFFLFPRIDQASIEQEDAVFHKYLVSQGFDVSTLGHKYRTSEEKKTKNCEDFEASDNSDESEVLKKTETDKLNIVETTESL